ncbi:hypothetical protein [Amphritea sp. HPY]|uniref:hypothetical protein n=1 Tax=Amphritea sp. HPY TaxID=3421652 RepID=UPI003D7DA18C
MGSKAVAPPTYSGSGGMTAWDIKPEAYLYHYENGFTAEDALGWSPELQFAWSRLGAAVTCKIEFDKADMIPLLQQQFGEKSSSHELNGIGFHAIQSRKVADFCSEERINSITNRLQRFVNGHFEP